jgi:hypothetical protein
MRWNNRTKVERPEFPKLIAVAGTRGEAEALIPLLKESDPDAALVSAGDRGLYLRVHNEAAEREARKYAESRSFPLA